MEIKYYFKETKQIIHPHIHKYLYVLLKFIFFGGNMDNRVANELLRMNRNINKKFKLNIELKKGRNLSNMENFQKILKFIKGQNLILANEIMENIIIRVLSFACQASSSDFFGKYIYNNLTALRNNKYDLLKNWFDKSSLPQIFKKEKTTILNIVNILKNDEDLPKYDSESRINEFYENNLFLKLLVTLRLSTNVFNKPKNNNKNYNYTDLESSKTKIYSKLSMYSFASNIFFSEELNMVKKDHDLPLASSILISSYIYCQNRHLPLINYSDDSENLSNVRFIYELSEAAINDCYLGLIIKPIRMETKIETLELNKNRFRSEGILELHKTFVFNKNIKKISIKGCGIKPIYLRTFIENLNYLENSSIEELDMTSNYLKSDSDTYLSKIITILTGLKTFILSCNNLKSGISSFFVSLKYLYKQNKSKLENLILFKCELDDISFYELGELLKSKYCKLKCLCLNDNIIPSDIKFFNALKKNRSLKEIYLYGCGITSDKTNEINKIICNTDLECLYINNNPIYDFNQFINIIYTNSLVKNKQEKEAGISFYSIPCLYNLNMNETYCFNRNIEKIKLIKEGFEKNNLKCIDILSVLYGSKSENLGTINYYNNIEKLNLDLQQKQEIYKNALREIQEKEVDEKKYKRPLGEEIKGEFKDLETNVDKIINDPNSKFSQFIRKEADKLRKSFSNNDDEKEENIKYQKFLNYIQLRRTEKILEKNNIIKEQKKLILI